PDGGRTGLLVARPPLGLPGTGVEGDPVALGVRAGRIPHRGGAWGRGPAGRDTCALVHPDLGAARRLALGPPLRLPGVAVVRNGVAAVVLLGGEPGRGGGGRGP